MTDQYNDNWNDFPINHHIDAPSVEDLNPSRNFPSQSSFSMLQTTYSTFTHQFLIPLGRRKMSIQGM